MSLAPAKKSPQNATSPPKDIYKNVCRHFSHNSSKMRTQASINKKTDKLWFMDKNGM